MLVDELGNKRKFFSERMDDEMLDRINVSKRKTIIFECDFFALLCALVTWKDLLFRCSLVLHTDNDAVAGLLYLVPIQQVQIQFLSWTLD